MAGFRCGAVTLFACVGGVLILDRIAAASPDAVTTRVVVLHGESAPGLPAGVRFEPQAPFVGYDAPRAASNGRVIDRLRLAGPGIDVGNSWAMYVTPSGGTPQLLIQDGSPAPGLGRDVIYDLRAWPGAYAGGPNGRMAYAVGLSGPGLEDNAGMVRATDVDGVFRNLIRTGDRAPGLPDGVTISAAPRFLAGFSPTITPDGSVIFWTDVQGPGVDSTNNTVVYAAAPGAELLPLLRQGDRAGGFTGDVFYSAFQRVTRSTDGAVSFLASLNGPDLIGSPQAFMRTEGG